MKRSTGILDGIRILDLSRMLSGPYATMMLADHGAEVIKIEEKNGDSSRRSGPFRKDDKNQEWAGYFVSLNRQKKSICLDLKNEIDKEFFKNLVKNVDILLENFRPGVMQRLGLSFYELKKLNPQLVYGSITGFGLKEFGESPYSNWPSYDVVAQAMGGLISLTGFDEKNVVKVGPGVADIFSGALMSFGLLAALTKAKKTGVGQLVEVSMYDAIVSMCERAIYQFDLTNNIPKPDGNGHPLLAPFGIYKALDGFIAIGIVEDTYWHILKKIISDKDLLNDKKYGTISLRAKNRHSLNESLNKWTITYKKSDLIKMLGGKIPFGPVNNAYEIFNDVHTQKRETVVEIDHFQPGKKPWRVAANPVKFLGYKFKLARPPMLGEHNSYYFSKQKEHNEDITIQSKIYSSGSYSCFINFVGVSEQKYLIACNSFKWLEGKSFYLICLIDSFQKDLLDTLIDKEIKFVFVEKNNSERIKHLSTSPNSIDKNIGESDTFIGAHVKIQEFEKELMLSAKIKI